MVLNDQAGHTRVLEGADQGLGEAGHHRVDGRSKDEPDDEAAINVSGRRRRNTWVALFMTILEGARIFVPKRSRAKFRR